MKEHRSEKDMSKDSGNPPVAGGTPENPMTPEQIREELLRFNADLLREKSGDGQPEAKVDSVPPVGPDSSLDQGGISMAAESAAGETIQETEWHLSRLAMGQVLRYSDRGRAKQIVERAQGKGSSVPIFRVTTVDHGVDKGTRLYTLRDLAKMVHDKGWKFKGKDKPDWPATEPELPAEPGERGIETPTKIEERLNRLKVGRSLEYVGENNTVINIFPSRTKELEVEYDTDLRPIAMGDTKVFTVVEGDGSVVSSGTFRTIAEKIAASKWKFRRNRAYATAGSLPSSDPVQVTEGASAEAEKAEFLSDGEEAVFDYLIEGKIPTQLKLRREGDRYISIGANGGAGAEFTEEEIQALAKSEGFVRRPGEVNLNPSADVSLPEQGAAAENEIVIALGESATLEKLSSDGTVEKRQRVEHVATGYYLFAPDGTRDAFPLSEKDFQTLFQGWRKSAEQAGDLPSVMEGETAPQQTVSVEDEGLLSALDARIEKLGQDLDFERTAYITRKLEQSGAWNRLGKLFHIKKRDGDDDEVERFKEFYTTKLIEWKDANLERISLISGRNERRQAMADLIREIEFEEAERLYDEEQRSRVEKLSVPYYQRMKELWEETRGSLTAQAHFEDPESGHYTLKEASSRDWLKLMMGGSVIVGQAVLQGVEKTGAAVNKFNKSKYGKYVLAAGLAGAGAVAIGGVTAGGVIPAALALKRLLSGMAVSVTVEKTLKDYTESNRAIKKVGYLEREDTQKLLDRVEYDTNATELSGERFVDLRSLDEFLSKEGIEKVHTKVSRRKLSKLFQKGGAILAGAAVGGLIPKDWYPIPSAHAADGVQVGSGAELPMTPATLRDAAVVAETAPSAAVNGALPDAMTMASAGADAASPVESGVEHVATGRAATLAARLNELVSTHTVKPGESIWKIATDSVKDVPDMDKRATTRFAKLLELRLQEKLTVIDPRLAEAAGFSVDANGNYTPSHIMAGAKLELGKLIPAEEMAKLMEEAKGDGPITLATVHAPLLAAEPAVITEPATPAPELTEAERVALEEARLEASVPAAVSADERAEIIGSFNLSTELVSEKGDVMRYVSSLPREEQEHLFRNFQRITNELFQTSEVAGGDMYDANYDPAQHPELSKTYISRVLQDHKLLWKNPFTSYDRLKNPLHGSQMDAIAKFAKAAAKTFGESVAAPRATESVQEYVLRMVAVADNQQVKIPGFRMIK